MRNLFDFGYEVSLKELRKALGKLLKESDEEKLQLVVKILPAGYSRP